MIRQHFNEEEPDSGERIVLDRAAFRALASDTRVDILRILDKRRKTLTELADDLGLAVATVKEHMVSLSNSGLIIVKDEGRKWKYYELTEKGKAVLYPERKKIWVMIASLIFMVMLASYMSFHDMGYVVPDTARSSVDGSIFGFTVDDAREAQPMALPEGDESIGDGRIADDVPDGAPYEVEEAEEDMGITSVDDEPVETSEEAEPEVDLYDDRGEPAEMTEREPLIGHVLGLPVLRYVSYLLVVMISVSLVANGYKYKRRRNNRT